MNKIFKYNDSPITFNHGEKMVNATEMAKPFGKRTNDWIVNKATQVFLDELSCVRGIPVTQLIVVKQGNSSQFTQGTWMHEDVALEFARWLSPAFGIWCNDRIKELLTTGSVSIDQYKIPKTLSEALRYAAEQQEQIESLTQDNKEKDDVIYMYDSPRDNSMSVQEAAQKLSSALTKDIGQKRLFDYLREINWVAKSEVYPTQRAVKCGYCVTVIDEYYERRTGITNKGMQELLKRIKKSEDKSVQWKYIKVLF